MDDPFKPTAATVMRPRPGAGRRPAGEPGPLRGTPAAADYGEPVPLGVQEILATGLNPLVQAASPLLLLAAHLRGTLSMPDLGGLRRQALDEMRRVCRGNGHVIVVDAVLPVRAWQRPLAYAIRRADRGRWVIRN